MFNNFILDKNNNIITYSDNNIICGFTLKPYDFGYNITKEKFRYQINKLEDYYNIKFNNTKYLNQVHSDIVHCITKESFNSSTNDGDGLITDLNDVLLITRCADCQLILLYDPVNGVIGNIHSGWKGTLKRIVSNGINTMINKYNSNVDDIVVYISPSIMKCCFEVGDDVYSSFVSEFMDININNYMTSNGNKYFIDTVGINKEVLLNMGVNINNIFTSNICSKCNSDIVHSYRADGINCGRNIAFIYLKKTN